jgi:hypothetical protein
MYRFPLAPRRLAALAFVVLAGVSAGACSRKDNILGPVVTGPVTWDNTVRHLIADRSEGTAPTGCTSCHHAGTTIADWTLYANVADDRDSVRATIAPGGRMRRFLKTGEAQVIMDWIDAGAPEK